MASPAPRHRGSICLGMRIRAVVLCQRSENPDNISEPWRTSVQMYVAIGFKVHHFWRGEGVEKWSGYYGAGPDWSYSHKAELNYDIQQNVAV